MTARLKRVGSLVLDALIVFSIVCPEACAYLRWPLLALYALIAKHVFQNLDTCRWIVKLVHDRRFRMAHGLEHATIAVLEADNVSVVHGYTHAHDRFVVALEAGQAHRLDAVRDAITAAIRRIRAGERSLAYNRRCGTSQAITAVSLWCVYVSIMLLTLILGGSTALFFALSVIALRIWLACHEELGLLVQRLRTVDTEFSSATVVEVRESRRVQWWDCPEDETWFEVVVDVRLGASHGGVVAVGPLG